MKQLGDILLEGGLVTPEQLAAAYAEHQRNGRSLGRVLVDQGILTEAQLVAALATQIGLRFVDLTDVAIDGSAVSRVPEAVCRRYTALPIGYEDGKLVVAMADPANVFAIDDIRSITGLDVKPVVATRADVLAAINRYHRADEELDDLTSTLAAEETEDLASLDEVVEDAPIVKFVNLLITQAVQDRASDIHIEPTERDLRVRFRIDGVLHEVMRSPRNIQSGVISRLKIMADMNIAERRVPQDGRMSVTVNGKKVDLRVASLPTVWGEKVVMRILDTSTALLTLSDLGFAEDNYARYSASFTKPYGMILVTGPTGSGKSTTLYATINIISSVEKNVITVEDPVEYRLPGINQIQTNVKAGLTFASALRTILRADPDIVLIGEIRDHETAQIAIEAALTGHLVLSTLHTNDAPSAVNRLIEMGIEPFLVGSALDCVLAQRLARRLCEKCKEPYMPTPQSLREAKFPWRDGEPLPTLYRAVGCAACAKTGYKGRIALHEVMTVTEEIERLAVERASAEAIGRVAREQGMVTLREDGLRKVAAGVTTLEEIFRVVV
ncbi:type II secretion system protein E (GspE) [Acidothermus cellulolyticus 11B]|uniref:Type II secretion system protein E (GspE) n=1 Tax=Acidothermus cellulolyticus (strain ATCC 43068 / DSM 8971 / 11B) TaxID=351607 RepID=A0LUI4_ACIC1|nr:ATPase, T2SS/T4P/T4SS family [Acidothermus cellulolyticus]ABK53094.1 type II secretion system protein E (GspE) [Acidothermus cellulolyticus 11B]